MFDPADPKSFVRRRLLPQVLFGVGAAIGLVVVASIGFWFALGFDHGFAFSNAFGVMFAIGLVAAAIAAVLAAMSGAWFGKIPLLLAGILCCWAGIFLGFEKGYQTWQSGPNPPAEAFADTAPIGALLLGWFPAGILAGCAFGVSSLVVMLIRKRAVTKAVEKGTG
jgi:MFS family permease